MSEDVIAEAWREDMERDALEWLLNEEEAARPRCAECRHLFVAQETAAPGGGLGLLDAGDAIVLCIEEPRWPLVVEDAEQPACECFEPRR